MTVAPGRVCLTPGLAPLRGERGERAPETTFPLGVSTL